MIIIENILMILLGMKKAFALSTLLVILSSPFWIPFIPQFIRNARRVI